MEFNKTIKGKQPQDLPAAGHLFLEYEQLHIQHGWTWPQIEQQITYDLLVTIKILKEESLGTPIYEYTKAFQEALVEFLNFPSPEKFLENVRDNYRDLTIETGFKETFPQTHEKVENGKDHWKAELSKFTYPYEFRGLLLGFWLVSFLKGYWQCLDFRKKYSRLNSGKRQKLAYLYIQQILTQSPELTETGITPELIQAFLKKVESSL